MKIIYVLEPARLTFDLGRVARMNIAGTSWSAVPVDTNTGAPVELARGIYRAPGDSVIRIHTGAIQVGDPKHPPPPPPPVVGDPAPTKAIADARLDSVLEFGTADSAVNSGTWPG